MLRIERFACNMLAENCYVVSDETNDCVIIDCGAISEIEENAIKQYVEEMNLKPCHLLVTHGHLDHNFGNVFIYDTYQLKPEVSQLDEHLMKTMPQQAKAFYDMTIEDNFPPIGKFLSDDELISFGNHQLRVIATPGHSKGSVTFYCEEENVAFTGDTLFHQSVGRTDLEGGSMFKIIQSLRQLAQLPDQTRVLPGHGEETTIGKELSHNPYMDR